MTDSLFNEPTEVRLEDLVGPDKKFKTVEDLAKGKIEADRFIDRLTAEAEAFRTELRARQSLEEIANSLKKAPNGEPTPTPRIEPGSNKQEEPAPTDLNALIEKELNARDTKAKRTSNLEKAKTLAKEKYGGDYNATLRRIAETLGVSDTFLTDVAASSPTAFEKLIDSVQPSDNTRPVAPPSTARDFSREPNPTNRKNQAYYSNLRRTDLNLYMSKKVQNEMHKEAMLQGSKFYE